MIRRAAILAALAVLAACAAQDPAPSGHVSYGPPNFFSTPEGRPESFHGTDSSWSPTDEHFGAATPAPFRGY